MKQHNIESVILAAESAAIGLLKPEVLGPSCQFSCLGNEYRGGIDAKDLRDIRQTCQKARQCSSATADFEYLRLLWETDLGDEVLEYSSTQKISGAEL